MDEDFGLCLGIVFTFRKEREKMNRLYLFLFRITRVPSSAGGPLRLGIHPAWCFVRLPAFLFPLGGL